MGLSSSSNSIVMLEAWSPVPQNVTLFGNKVVADIIRDHTGVGGSLIQCDRCLWRRQCEDTQEDYYLLMEAEIGVI